MDKTDIALSQVFFCETTKLLRLFQNIFHATSLSLSAKVNEILSVQKHQPLSSKIISNKQSIRNFKQNLSHFR